MINLPTEPALRGFQWREIGPGRSGRPHRRHRRGRKEPVDLLHRLCAVSGLWKTMNNGTTFTPLFDEIGPLDRRHRASRRPNPNVLYVGTGESRTTGRAASFGNGVYKSIGRRERLDVKFGLVGLQTESIGRIVVHPKNPDIVWVAAVGHLFGPNAERGVFMTTRRRQDLEPRAARSIRTSAPTTSRSTRAIRITCSASTYERRRASWGFVGGGLGSRHSRDRWTAARRWKRITATTDERPAARHDGPHRARLVQEHAERDLRADRSRA